MRIGKNTWAIAEGYIPEWSNGPEGSMTSHESICILNTCDQEAKVKITVYFSDKEPSGPYNFVIPARRTNHLRLNDFKDPELPKGVDFASLIESDVPIVVQHTRLDSRQAENTIMTTIAFGV